MVDREHINNFLRLNGISPLSPEEEIANMLRIARWDDADIRVALNKLKNIEDDTVAENTGRRNVFFSDSPIAQDTLTSLLGVNVSIPNARRYAEETRRRRFGNPSTFETAAITLLSVIVGVCATLLIMYLYGIGPFYTPVENFVF